MRSITLPLLALGLVLSVAIPVMAQGPSSHAPPTAAGDHRANATERHERHQALETARQAALDSFKENRTAALQAYHAALNATRASFMENKTAVLAACNASATAGHNGYEAGDDANETAHANNSAAAHCVRDGLKPLIEKAHADIKAAQDAFHDAMVAARHACLDAFRQAREDANAKYGHL